LFVSRVPICQKFKHIIKDTFRKEEEKYQALKTLKKKKIVSAIENSNFSTDNDIEFMHCKFV
jgi:hypothetical protein